jgi:hypothetical protein
MHEYDEVEGDSSAGVTKEHGEGNEVFICIVCGFGGEMQGAKIVQLGKY